MGGDPAVVAATGGEPAVATATGGESAGRAPGASAGAPGNGPVTEVDVVLVESRGALDKAAVQRVLLSHRDAMAFCWRSDGTSPRSPGYVKVAFTIMQNGKPTQVRPTAGVNSEVDACVTRVVARAVFPKPRSGTADATYRFNFTDRQ